MLRDMTSIPMEAGTACFISKLPIDAVPKVFDFLFINILTPALFFKGEGA
jgi:hypothetical protein